MKYTALILLSAVALAKSGVSSLYPNGCPKDWSVEQLLPHPDCRKFYQCWDGKLVEHSCPADLYFSVEANQCEWSEVIDCDATYVPEKESDEAENNNIGAGNCDPSKAPEICAEEGSDSILVAHEKCNKYYICSHGKPVPQRCQAGLFFNPKTDRCDWPENVDCGDRVITDGGNGDSGNGGSNSNESNDNGDSGNGGSNSNESGENGDSGNGGNDNGNDNQNVGAGNCDPSKAPEICAADDSDSVLVAHEKCNKYYICAHGKPVPQRCQAGLFFNPKTDRCDWPENVDCGDRVIPDGGNGDSGNGGSNSNESNDNGDSGNGGSNSNESNENGENGDSGNGGNDNGNDNQNVGAGNCDPSKAPEICAADDSDSVLVAHEKCNKYYICAHGKPVPQRCQAGLFFNPKTDRCDWPENVDCGDRVIPDGGNGDSGNGGSNSNESNDNGDSGNDGSNSNESNENGENGDSGNGGNDNGNDNQNVGAGNCDPSKAPEICAADDSDSVLVAHEKCNKYYICAHGKPVPMRCQAGLFFNPKTDQCDWPENVDCGDRVIPDGGNGDSGNGGSNSNESNDNGDSGNGGNDNGNDNQNVGAGNCDPSKAPEICAADDSDSVLVAHEKCNKYYICAHGKPVPQRCQAGLFFNPKTDRCDWPENVDCGDRVIPDGGNGDSGNGGSNSNESNDNGDSGNDGSNSNESNENGDSGNGGNDNGNDNQNVGAGNCDPSKAPEICAADDSDSVLVAHEKCNKYYICAHGKPVPMRCQAGLFFNPKTDQCDWPENVDCGDRVIPDGGNGDSGNGGSNSNESNDNGDSGNGGSNSNESNDNGDSGNGGSNSNESGENGDSGNGGNDNGNDNQNVGAGNCDPSKAPEICAADDSDSVLVAHEKCNKYYICAHGKPVPQRCQAGLFFNPKTDRCDWPENVDCGDRVIPDGGNGDSGNGGSNSNESNDNGDSGNGGSNSNESNENGENGDSGNGGNDNGNDNQNVGAGNCDPSKAPEICAADDSDSVLVAHEKCNKYYICAHGKPVPQRCQAGLFFNPKTDRCDWPENVDCGDRVIPDGGNGDSGNGGSNSNESNDNGDSGNDGSNSNESNENGENGDSGNGGNDNGNDNQNVGAGNCDPSKAPEICAADDSDSVLVAHEKCNKYYICAHGKPVPMRCQAGLFFNPKTDQCDWPENVDCGDRVIPDGGNGDSGNGGSNSNESNDNGDSGNGGSNSNESNDNGDSGNGGSNSNESGENGDSGNGGNDNGNDNQNVGAGNCDPSKAPEICAADDSDSVLVAHEKCNKYYICAHGKPVPQRCQAGLFFNPKTDRCDWPENVDCGDRVIPDGGNGDSGSGGSNSNESNDNGDSGNGGSNSNESNENGDSGNGGNDNGNDNQNVGAGNCDPSKAPEICAADDSDSVLVAHEKCNKYYICAHGKPVPQRCQAGLFFNPKTDRCDWPENVDCGDRVIPDGGNGDSGNGGSNSNESNDNGDSGNGGSNSNESNENGENGDSGNGGNDNGNDNQNVGAGNCDPSKAPEICAADDSDSVLVAHEKCNKYYICAHGKPVPQRCQAGLFFNPKTDRCDWPENVDCGDRVIPDGGNGDSGNGGSNSNESNDNGDSGNDGSNSNESNENGENGDSGNGGNDNGNDNQNVGAGNCDPSKAPEICAADDSDSVLVAHEKCNKYYICAHGKPVPMRCQAGLFFNPKTDQCDWPENVDCGDRVIPDGGNGDSGNGGSNSNESNDNGDSGNGGSNSNESNDNGDSGNGGSNSNESGENGDSGNGGNDNGNDNQNVGAGNCDPSKAPEICAADDSDSVLVAHEKCNKYYICAHGKPVPQRCQAGLFFNPKTDRCDWPENVDCGDRVIPDGGNGDSGSGGSNSNESNDNGDSGNGGSNSNESNENGDSGNGGNDNGNDNQNVGAGNCDPSKAPEICAADDSDSVLVAHEKCNKYYICAHGKPVPQRCQAGLFFNPKTDRCDWPENVDCGDRVIPDGGNGDSGNGGSNSNESNDNGDSGNDGSNSNESNENGENGDSGNGGNDNGNDNQNVGAGNCDPSKAPEICAADDSDSVLVAHEKCNKYYVCAHGKPVPMRCQAGLFFNPKTDQCDWPENVDCGDRVIPDGGNGGNENGDGSNSNESNDNGDSGGGGSNSNESNDNGDNSDSGNGGNDNGNDNQNVGAGNCDPSKAPEICAADDSDSVLVAHEKCNKFYICAHGKPVPQRCQAGLFFNPKTDRCDWPENVDCGDRVKPDGGNGDSGNGGSNSNESNDNGDSGNGGSNSNESNDNGDSGNSGSNSNESNENGENGDSGNGGNDNGNDNQNVGAGNCDPSKAPEICAADDSDSVLVAHEKCNKYYVCAHGKPVPMRCQAGLFFNPKTDQCDWPENVDCGDRVIPDGGNGDSGNDGSNSKESNENGENGDSGNGGNDNGNDNQNVGAGNCDPSKAPEICAADDSDSVLVAHEKCNKYYVCAHGKPLARRCQAGLFFNPKTDRCDWPENVDCGDRVIPDGENGDSENGDGGNSNENNGDGDNDNGGNDNGGNDNDGHDNGGNDNDNQNVGAGNYDPSKAPEICAAEDSDSVLVAHEKCNKFYVCANGKPLARRCQTGLFFNPKTDQCDWPDNVDCGDRLIPGGENEDNDVNDNVSNDNDNQNNGECNCDPSKAPEICAADGSDDVLVAHEKCNKFYVCAHGKPFAKRCQVGLLFNPKIERCDWPENVDCGDRLIPSEENEENDGNGNNVENDNGGNDNGGNDNDSENTGACNCDQAPKICAEDGSDGVLVAHEKCNKYYSCANGKPVSLRCPANLLYNPHKETCDWPENVKCSDKVSPDVEDNDNGNSGDANVGGGNNDPSLAPIICGDENSDGVFVAHEICTKFYTCSNGKPVTLRCPANLFFDTSIDACDWPQKVDCGNRSVPSGFDASLNKHLEARRAFMRRL